LLKLDDTALDGSVTFIASLEKIPPSRAMRLPGVGCCIHAPLRTVSTERQG